MKPNQINKIYTTIYFRPHIYIKKKRALTFHINALFKIFLVPSINPRFHKEPFFYISDALSRFYRTFYRCSYSVFKFYPSYKLPFTSNTWLLSIYLHGPPLIQILLSRHKTCMSTILTDFSDSNF